MTGETAVAAAAAAAAAVAAMAVAATAATAVVGAMEVAATAAIARRTVIVDHGALANLAFDARDNILRARTPVALLELLIRPAQNSTSFLHET